MSQPIGSAVEPHAGERLWGTVRDAVWQAVVVDEQVLRLLSVAVLAHGHALIEDVPGVGKTLLARAFSRALGLGFARVQGTPDLLPGDVLGASVLEGSRFRFIPGPVFTNILLVDEINRATPRTQSALLEAMEEGRVSIEGETRDLPDPSWCSRPRTPSSSRARSRCRRPSSTGSWSGSGSATRAGTTRPASPAATGPAPSHSTRCSRSSSPTSCSRCASPSAPSRSSAQVEAYIVDLVRETRQRPEVRLGGSPRSTMALYRATQAWAYLAGRDFVVPDDAKALVPAVLGHRMILDIDRQLQGSTAEDVIEAVLESVAVPPVQGAGSRP